MDQPREPGPCVIEGMPYHFLRAPHYNDNSLGRLRNIAVFASRLAASGRELLANHGRPDAIIFSSPTPYGFLAAHSLSKRYRAECIFEVRDLWPSSLVELCGMSALHPMVIATGWLERFAYGKADKVVSLLPGTLEHMKKAGLNPRKWHHVPNGIEPQEREVGSQEHECFKLVRQWREAGCFVVVYAGALGRPNNVQSLILGLQKAKPTGAKIKVIIIGRGELKDQLRALIEELSLSDDIAMFEQIPKLTVRKLLGMCSAGYISLKPAPLLRFGVSPNKLFDYMLAGLPVVFALRTERDIVADAECGLSADPADPAGIGGALAKLAGMLPAEREQMGRNGRSYVMEGHSYASLAEKYAKLMGFV